MPPKNLSSIELQAQYGPVLSQSPLADATSPYYLHQALTSRRPPVAVTHATVKVWWSQHKLVPGGSKVSSAQELQDKHENLVFSLVEENPSAFKLCKALRLQDPPVFITDGVAKEWLRKFQGDLRPVNNAGHLESDYGELIRTTCPQEELAAGALSSWLRRQCKVSVESRVCQTWRASPWRMTAV